MSNYKTGDLITCIITHGDNNNEIKFGEVVGVDLVTQKIEVSFLKRTALQEGRIWHFEESDEWVAINKESIVKHVPIPTGSNGAIVAAGWLEIGFVAGGNGFSFCLVADEKTTSLPLLLCEDSESEEEEEASTDPAMHGYQNDGWCVPDDDPSCEPFHFADINDPTLSDEAKEFIETTHKAVHDFERWNPTDKQSQGIKTYIDNADLKACVQSDNARLKAGKSSISFTKPPLKRKR